jgi:hypothetical protein
MGKVPVLGYIGVFVHTEESEDILGLTKSGMIALVF